MDALKPRGDVKLVFEVKDGNLTSQIEGDSTDCAIGAIYLALRVCALSGKTPAACEITRHSIARTIDDIGPILVKAMFLQEQAKPSDPETEKEGD